MQAQHLEATGVAKTLPLFPADQLAIGQKKCIESKSGRKIVLIRISQQEFSALDSNCYHQGGPLGESGDLEDLGDSLYLRCPHHQHRIDVRSGELYDHMNRKPTGKFPQRHFRCFVQNGIVHAVVTGSKGCPTAGKVESDKWNLPFLNSDGASPSTCPGSAQPGVNTFAAFGRKKTAAQAVQRKLQLRFSEQSTADMEMSPKKYQDVEMS